MQYEQDFSERRLGGSRLISSYYGSFATSRNSDYFPVLDLNAFRAAYLGQSATEVFALRNGPLPVIEMLDRDKSRRSRTLVSPSSPLPILRSVHVATVLRDYYVDRVAFDPEVLPAGLRFAVRETDRMLLDCGLDGGDETMINHLNRLSGQLAPFLQPEELALIWEAYAGCAEQWPVHLQRWFSLLKAVSARDAGRMAVLSGELLESGDDALDTERMRYLVAASMLAYLSAGDRASALATWAKYGSSTMSSGRLSTVIRLLIAYSHA